MKRAILNEQFLNGYVINSNLPIGAPMAWLSEVPPVGFLAFDGSEYNQEDFPELYEVVKNIPSFHSDTEGKFKIPNLKGRVLQGADTVIGELIEAGLPNIIGEVKNNDATYGSIQMVNPKFEGAFSGQYHGNAGWSGSVFGCHTLKIDASKGETKADGTLKTEDEPHVYGNSDTVQMDAFTVYWVIKATNYVSLEKNAIDDTKTTNANAWSAEKIFREILGSNTGKIDTLLDTTITTTGTFPLAHNVNDYDFILINHAYSGNTYIQGSILSRKEVEQITSASRTFTVNHGNGSASSSVVGYFNNNNVVITTSQTEVITSITGIKLGTIRLVNEIKDPTPSQSYSTEETLTGGTWVDGKPTYKLTITGLNINVNGTWGRIAQINNLDTLCHIEMIGVDDTGYNCFVVPLSRHRDGIVYADVINYGVTCKTVTLIYTKTTD